MASAKCRLSRPGLNELTGGMHVSGMHVSKPKKGNELNRKFLSVAALSDRSATNLYSGWLRTLEVLTLNQGITSQFGA